MNKPIFLLIACLLGVGPALATAIEEDPLAQTRANWFTAAAVGLTAAYGASAWWRGDLDKDFRVRGEGWFGRDTYAGGADKLGHAYSSYLGTRGLSRGYQMLGLSRQAALGKAVGVSLITFLGIEAVDGFSKTYRFGPEDALMNLSGIGLAWLLESDPGVDRLLDFRLRYQRSPEARAQGVIDPIEDYNGQTYLIAIKAEGIAGLAARPATRYLELLLGYGTRGYRPAFDPNERSRRLYLGVGLNLAALIDDSLPVDRYEAARRSARGVFEIFQPPFAAALGERAD